LLLIDLDGFKLVNDVYGHAAGDTMLTEFGRILRASVRAGDVTARIGGDEFVVLVTDLSDEASAVATAERILAGAVATPVLLGDDTHTIRASIGVATVRPGETPKALLRRADIAMYRAKHVGTHGVQVHDPSMIDQRTTRSPFIEELAGAVERDEFHVLYRERDPGRRRTTRRWPRFPTSSPRRQRPPRMRRDCPGQDPRETPWQTRQIRRLAVWDLDNIWRT
jgi:diguanylate cyclase (GGDEF)-like protein